jgi:hypothetical protein
MIFSKNKKKLSDFIRSMDEKCGHSLSLSPSVSFPYHERLSSRFFFSFFIYFSLTMAGGEERNKSKRKSGEPKKKFIPPMFRD